MKFHKNLKYVRKIDNDVNEYTYVGRMFKARNREDNYDIITDDDGNFISFTSDDNIHITALSGTKIVEVETEFYVAYLNRIRGDWAVSKEKYVSEEDFINQNKTLIIIGSPIYLLK